MHIHVRIHRWVVWWFCVGLVLGVVAVVNMLGRHLSREDNDIIILMGLWHWVLGGMVCYSLGGIRIVQPPQGLTKTELPGGQGRETPEWHPASDFLLPGNRKSLLPPKH